MDNKLTKDIQLFLQKEQPTETEVREAAMLLLRINRNKALYSNIMRRPAHYLPKLTYELNKHLRYRLDGLTLEEVRKLDAEVLPQVKQILSVVPEDLAEEGDTTTLKLGKRADHETLPEEVKALWTKNIDRWKKIKENYEICLALEMPCDRYEYLKILKQTYEAYKDDMAKYDAYDPNAAEADAASIDSPDSSDSKENVVTDNAKTIGNARAYISKNRDKYVTLSQGDNTDKAAELKQKIQERVNTLIACNATIDDDTTKWLAGNGFTLS